MGVAEDAHERRKEAWVLELAILGILNDQPLHGYELRKRLNATLGAFRAFSYGSLYPTLRKMREQGLIAEDTSDLSAPLGGRRSKVVYKITAEGKERFSSLLCDVSPGTFDDEQFGVHLAFFAQTDEATRLRILEGRRRRVEERRERMRSALARTRERLDHYTLELQKHGLDSVEREVRWLNELIDTERGLRTTEKDRDGEPADPTTSNIPEQPDRAPVKRKGGPPEWDPYV